MVDGWIAQLMECKPLSEEDVKKLCDLVRGKPSSDGVLVACVLPICSAVHVSAYGVTLACLLERGSVERGRRVSLRCTWA